VTSESRGECDDDDALILTSQSFSMNAASGEDFRHLYPDISIKAGVSYETSADASTGLIFKGDGLCTAMWPPNTVESGDLAAVTVLAEIKLHSPASGVEGAGPFETCRASVGVVLGDYVISISPGLELADGGASLHVDGPGGWSIPLGSVVPPDLIHTLIIVCRRSGELQVSVVIGTAEGESLSTLPPGPSLKCRPPTGTDAVFDGARLKAFGVCMRVHASGEEPMVSSCRRLAVVEGVWRRFPTPAQTLTLTLTLTPNPNRRFPNQLEAWGSYPGAASGFLPTEVGGPCDEFTTALWSLAGESVSLDQGCMRDLTGQGADGTLQGAWSTNLKSPVIGAVQGKGECYVEVASDTRLDASRDFTVEAWLEVHELQP